MPVTADRPAPYAPASALLEVLDRFRNRGLQGPITTEVLEEDRGFREPVATHTIYATPGARPHRPGRDAHGHSRRPTGSARSRI